MERLEITLLVKSIKRLEFKQTLYNLSEKFQKHCTSLKITESNNFLSYSILAEWETAANMQEAFNNYDFAILSGAIKALCEKVQIRLNDKLIGSKISKLNSFIIRDLKNM
jgi:hypothetical protein